VSESARISFSEGPDGAIFFTSAKGDVRRKDNSGQIQILKTPDQGVFVDIAIDRTGEKVAVELVDERSSELPSIVLFDFSPALGLQEIGRVNGLTPRFSGDGELFFLLPNRFVPQSGFGGNFWVDFQIMHLTNVGDDPKPVGETRQDLREEAVESIVIYQPHEGNVNKLIHCKEAHVCSGDPDVSIDGTKVMFVSDKEEAFFYSLFEVDIESGEVVPFEGGDLFRFIRSPAYSHANPGSVITLGANVFSMDGQPELAVVRLMGSKTETIVTNVELHACEP
jgi:hypothetical protein